MVELHLFVGEPDLPTSPPATTVNAWAQLWGELHLVGLALSEQRYLPGMRKIRRGEHSARQRGPVSLAAREKQGYESGERQGRVGRKPPARPLASATPS